VSVPSLLPSFDLEEPQPEAPPGLDQLTDTLLAWLKWGVLVAGIGGLLICAGMIILGRRNRNQMATDGVLGSLWVLGGLALASAAATLVGVFI
jgi:type II secretory pathway component PulF